MIFDIYKVGPLTYPRVFQCENDSKFKAEVSKLLEKHGVRIPGMTTKYKHTHMAFVKALKKLLTENLFKVQDAQELNDPKKVPSTWGLAFVWIGRLTSRHGNADDWDETQRHD